MLETPLGPGREFDAIRRMAARWGPAARALGDDAAVVDVPDGERLVVSTDCSTEDVHFRRAWITPEEIGWRATMAAASDLAAMAARPLGVLAALTVPDGWRADLDALAAGIGDAAMHAACPIIGGDLSDGATLALTITVLGSAASPLTRSRACVGDALWLTGMLGGPALAVSAWSAGRAPTPDARARFAHPIARIPHARWLASHGASAAIDVSDGLVADARHLAAASAVRLAIELERVPTCAGATPLAAASSGEEYELLVAAPASLDASAFERAFGTPITCVGMVVAGASGVDVTLAGAHVDVAGGYDHFSR